MSVLFVALFGDAKAMDIAQDVSAHNSLARLRREEILTDVELLTDTGRVLAHRVVLAAQSEFFKAKLSPEWESASHATAPVRLPHLQHNTVLTIVEGIYTGSLDISHGNALALFAAASELDLASIACASARVRPKSARDAASTTTVSHVSWAELPVVHASHHWTVAPLWCACTHCCATLRASFREMQDVANSVVRFGALQAISVSWRSSAMIVCAVSCRQSGLCERVCDTRGRMSVSA